MKLQIFFPLILLTLLNSCTPKPENTLVISMPTDEPVAIYSPTEIYTPSGNNPQILQTAWSHLDKGDEWTQFTQNAIRDYGQDLLKTVPNDIANYCAKYPQLNNRGRGDFWVGLISKLAYFESSYNPETSYTERFSDNEGNSVISRGLLQLSIESANGNYACGLTNATQLHDPKTNLECGVRIFNKLVIQNGVINTHLNGSWQGLSRYWSPFRDSIKNQTLMDYTNTLKLCR